MNLGCVPLNDAIVSVKNETNEDLNIVIEVFDEIRIDEAIPSDTYTRVRLEKKPELVLVTIRSL